MLCRAVLCHAMLCCAGHALPCYAEMKLSVSHQTDWTAGVEMHCVYVRWEAERLLRPISGRNLIHLRVLYIEWLEGYRAIHPLLFKATWKVHKTGHADESISDLGAGWAIYTCKPVLYLC